METTAEKLLCDSTSCVQQTAAATQNSTVILLYLVLIEFALEKLFIKKKKKKKKYSYFNIKGNISWQHILWAGVRFGHFGDEKLCQTCPTVYFWRLKQKNIPRQNIPLTCL